MRVKKYKVLVHKNFVCGAYVTVRASSESDALEYALERARETVIDSWFIDDQEGGLTGVYLQDMPLGEQVIEVTRQNHICNKCEHKIGKTFKYCPGCGVAV